MCSAESYTPSVSLAILLHENIAARLSPDSTMCSNRFSEFGSFNTADIFLAKSLESFGLTKTPKGPTTSGRLAVFAAIIGTLIGIIAGYYGGWLDRLLMRINDAFIALPLLPLLIVLAAVDLEKVGIPKEIAQSEDISLYRIVVIVALVGWNTVARLVRAETLTLREHDFVRAAVALGASPTRVMARHILPNAISPIIVAITLSVGTIILFESILSFLGLGIQPPVASWGNMLSNAQDLIWSAPQLAVWPGIMIFVTVIAFNFLGDGLQDALDPRALH